ncbi:MAG: shikimate dehydrogenase [Synergistaceae bacterium]|nr:shikimate dehydrogenase [Synergistaceae bacterium]
MDKQEIFNSSVNTKFFGLLGNPLGQSAAPFMHNSVYQKLGIDALYVPLELSMEQLEPVVANLENFHYAGSGVTMPFKTQVHKYLDVLADSARFTEVVNTIVFEEGKKIGHNTDGTGFVLSLQKQLGLEIPDHNYLILGAGGAGTAIACALAMEGAKDIKSLCIAKDYFCAETLFDRVDRHFPSVCTIGEMTEKSIAAALEKYDVIIHATKVGMYPKVDDILFAPDLLKPHHIVADVVYVPVETTLLREAAARGCRTLSGLWMNTYQAAEQMRLWLGIEPPMEYMYNHSLEYLMAQGKA